MGCLGSVLKSAVSIAVLVGGVLVLDRFLNGPEPDYIAANPYNCNGTSQGIVSPRDKYIDTQISLNGNVLSWNISRSGKADHQQDWVIGGDNIRYIDDYPDYIKIANSVTREPGTNTFTIIPRVIKNEIIDKNSVHVKGALWIVNLGRCTITEERGSFMREITNLNEQRSD